MRYRTRTVTHIYSTYSYYGYLVSYHSPTVPLRHFTALHIDHLQKSGLFARTPPLLIFADMYDPQTLASDPQRPLEVHR